MQAVTDAALGLPDEDQGLDALSAAYRQLEALQGWNIPDAELPLSKTALGPMLIAFRQSPDPLRFVHDLIGTELSAVRARVSQLQARS